MKLSLLSFSTTPINLLMQQFQQTQSIELPTSPPLEYEKCDFCSRSFFKGKLKYHLKLCTQDNPMSISPKKSPRTHRIKPDTQIQQKDSVIPREEKLCEYSHAKFPHYLYEKHIAKCWPKQAKEEDLEPSTPKNNPKSSTQVNFKEPTTPVLPVIKRSSRQRAYILPKQPYQVKLRLELSCFRRAQDIKQVQCPACQRIFSKEASLRHVPICQALREKERMSIAIKRKGNRSVGEQYTQRIGRHELHQDPPQGKGSTSILEVNPQNSSFPK